MSQASIWEKIQRFNRGRDPERLALKYEAMRRDCFAFFRGTAHLFYEDWPLGTPLNDAPLAWICGDLHLENFGSYKGDNRLSYFDVNDFDEAALAPCTWDLARFLCSLLLYTRTQAIKPPRAVKLCLSFLDAYSRELELGKARWIERATASGMIRDLLKNLKRRSRADLLDERTVKRHGKARLKIDGRKALAASGEEKKRITALIDGFAVHQAHPDFFEVLDVARRIAGAASLGLERYVVLIRGNGGQQHYLLDLKYQPGSVLSPYATVAQPVWNTEAERVVALQQRSQAIAPAFLAAVSEGGRSYLLKELMPKQDRLDLSQSHGKCSRLQKAVEAMAELVAWQHLRTSGWRGSAIADQWEVFGRQSGWKRPLLDYAQSYSSKIEADWQSFKTDFADSL